MLRSRRPHPVVAAGLVGLALLAAGCGGSGNAAAPSTAAGTGASSTTVASADLLSFSAPTIGGGELDAASFRGRPTLLWFWAPW